MEGRKRIKKETERRKERRGESEREKRVKKDTNTQTCACVSPKYTV